MKHYAIEKWTDFVRGLLGEPERTAMENHLKTACSVCNRQVTLLRAVGEARNEIAVPDSLITRARAIFPRVPVHAESTIRKLLAELTFDSQHALAPAGLRSGARGVRRLTFGVDDVVIELLVDSESTRRTVTLTGQISASLQSGPPVEYRVRVVARSEALEQTVSNTFGEFHLEFPQRAGLRLLIESEKVPRQIEVPLDLVFGARSGSSKSGSKRKSNPLE